MGSDPINYGDDLAVLTFYFYRWEDVMRIPEALAAGGRRGRSGKLRGVAEPAGADARVCDAGETV